MENPSKKARTKRRSKANLDTNLESEEISRRFENDRIMLLRTFPQEVWLMIFKKEKNCESLKNWYNASPFFKFLLAPRRMEFLFFTVWTKVLGKLYLGNFHKRRIPASAILGDMDSEEYNHWVTNARTSISWYSEILKMRLVCKTWCAAVDHFYQSLENHEVMHGLDLTRHKCTDGISSTAYNFYFDIDDHFYNRNTKHNPARFLHHFQNSHGDGTRNPFITSNVRISFTNDDSVEFCTNLESLLTKFKVHIRHLTVDGFTTWDTNLMACHYSKLCRLLRQLPNLETLRFTKSKRGINSNEMYSFQGIFGKELSPITTKLKFLRIDYLPIAFYNEIMRQNPQISTLELYSCSCNITKWQITNRPNLTKLGITINTESDLEYLVSTGEILHLQALHLRFAIYIRWSKIFALLENKWNESLTDVLLDFPSASKSEEALHYYEFASLKPALNLPTVKRLKLEMRNVACLDFILPLKGTLEELEIRGNCLQSDTYKHLLDFMQTLQKIQLVGYWNKLLESNIWTLFPKLRLVKFFWGKTCGNNCYKYTREAWRRKV